MKERYPEVAQNLGLFKFPGRRQRETPVANIRGAVELVLLLPGHHAARIRRQAASLLVRYLGGDGSLVDEVCRLRGFQEELAAQNPEDPRRVFGEAVEAAAPALGEQQLARVCTDIVTRLLPEGDGAPGRAPCYLGGTTAREPQRPCSKEGASAQPPHCQGHLTGRQATTNRSLPRSEKAGRQQLEPRAQEFRAIVRCASPGA